MGRAGDMTRMISVDQIPGEEDVDLAVFSVV